MENSGGTEGAPTQPAVMPWPASASHGVYAVGALKSMNPPKRGTIRSKSDETGIAKPVADTPQEEGPPKKPGVSPLPIPSVSTVKAMQRMPPPRRVTIRSKSDSFGSVMVQQRKQERLAILNNPASLEGARAPPSRKGELNYQPRPRRARSVNIGGPPACINDTPMGRSLPPQAIRVDSMTSANDLGTPVMRAAVVPASAGPRDVASLLVEVKTMNSLAQVIELSEAPEGHEKLSRDGKAAGSTVVAVLEEKMRQQEIEEEKETEKEKERDRESEEERNFRSVNLNTQPFSPVRKGSSSAGGPAMSFRVMGPARPKKTATTSSCMDSEDEDRMTFVCSRECSLDISFPNRPTLSGTRSSFDSDMVRTLPSSVNGVLRRSIEDRAADVLLTSARARVSTGAMSNFFSLVNEARLRSENPEGRPDEATIENALNGVMNMGGDGGHRTVAQSAPVTPRCRSPTLFSTSNLSKWVPCFVRISVSGGTIQGPCVHQLSHSVSQQMVTTSTAESMLVLAAPPPDSGLPVRAVSFELLDSDRRSMTDVMTINLTHKDLTASGKETAAIRRLGCASQVQFAMKTGGDAKWPLLHFVFILTIYKTNERTNPLKAMNVPGPSRMMASAGRDMNKISEAILSLPPPKKASQRSVSEHRIQRLVVLPDQAPAVTKHTQPQRSPQIAMAPTRRSVSTMGPNGPNEQRAPVRVSNAPLALEFLALCDTAPAHFSCTSEKK